MHMERINLSLNPLDYTSVVRKHNSGVNALKKLIPENHEIDSNGSPTASTNFSTNEEKENQKAINRLIYNIYRLNGATQILLQERRPQLNQELSKFRDLGAGERLRELIKEKEKEKVKELNKKLQLEEVNKIQDEPIEIGSAIKDLTTEQKKQRDESYRYMAEKRRAFAEASKISGELSALGFSGLLMSGPEVYVPFFTSDGIGIKSMAKSVRLGTLMLFETEILSALFKHGLELKNKIITDSQMDFIFNTSEDQLANLQLISRAVSQKNYGTNDRDSEVAEKASKVEDFAYRAAALIKNKENHSLNTFFTSIV